MRAGKKSGVGIPITHSHTGHGAEHDANCGSARDAHSNGSDSPD